MMILNPYFCLLSSVFGGSQARNCILESVVNFPILLLYIIQYIYTCCLSIFFFLPHFWPIFSTFRKINLPLSKLFCPKTQQKHTYFMPFLARIRGFLKKPSIFRNSHFQRFKGCFWPIFRVFCEDICDYNHSPTFLRQFSDPVFESEFGQNLAA